MKLKEAEQKISQWIEGMDLDTLKKLATMACIELWHVESVSWTDGWSASEDEPERKAGLYWDTTGDLLVGEENE